MLLVLGGRDERVALEAARLAQQFMYRVVMISGGAPLHNEVAHAKWQGQTEADHFYEVMMRSGFEGDILLERTANSTGDNARLSYEMLREQKIAMPKTLLLVTKPYMERRALATFEAQWPDKKTHISVTSPRISFLKYANSDQPLEDVLNIMVGDFQRIIEYPKMGWQSKQLVPEAYRLPGKFWLKQGIHSV